MTNEENIFRPNINTEKNTEELAEESGHISDGIKENVPEHGSDLPANVKKEPQINLVENIPHNQEEITQDKNLKTLPSDNEKEDVMMKSNNIDLELASPSETTVDEDKQQIENETIKIKTDELPLTCNEESTVTDKHTKEENMINVGSTEIENTEKQGTVPPDSEYVEKKETASTDVIMQELSTTTNVEVPTKQEQDMSENQDKEKQDTPSERNTESIDEKENEKDITMEDLSITNEQVPSEQELVKLSSDDKQDDEKLFLTPTDSNKETVVKDKTEMAETLTQELKIAETKTISEEKWINTALAKEETSPQSAETEDTNTETTQTLNIKAVQDGEYDFDEDLTVPLQIDLDGSPEKSAVGKNNSGVKKRKYSVAKLKLGKRSNMNPQVVMSPLSPRILLANGNSPSNEVDVICSRYGRPHKKKSFSPPMSPDPAKLKATPFRPEVAEKKRSVEEEEEECEKKFPVQMVLGDLCWAFVSGHPWWPGMITEDAISNQYTKIRGTSAKGCRMYHVQYFGPDLERGWVAQHSLIKFRSLAGLKEDVAEVPKPNTGQQKALKKIQDLKGKRKDQWDIALC